MKTVSSIVSLWLICLTQLVFAQETLHLQDAISLALNNNYDIKLVRNDEAVATNNVNLGAAGILPVVAGNLGTGGGRVNSVQTQSTGTERVLNGVRNSNFNYGVGLDWTIFDGFKMFATYDRLKTLEEQGKTNVKGQILTTISDVITAYYNLAKQQQLVRAADSAIDVSALRVKIAQNKLALGKGSKLDVLAANVDYNADTSNYLQQLNLMNNYRVTLNQLMARDLNSKFLVDDTITIDNGLIYTELATQMEKLNPDLQSALLSKRIAELKLKEVKGDRYPRVSLNGGYDINRSTTPTGFNTQFKSKGFTYGLTASINIFNGFLQNQNEKNAKIAINSSSLTFNKVKQDISAQLLSAYQNYTTYLDLVKLEKRNVEIAKQNLEITLEKYRLGSIAPLELREAQRNSVDANNRSLEIQYQAKLAEIALKQISGTLNIQ